MKTAEQLIERENIIHTITSIFIHLDAHQWKKLTDHFADRVLLDYTSMADGEPVELTPAALADSWKKRHAGFESIQHAISNFLVTLDRDEADVFHYGTAWHHLPNNSGEDVWIVVGTYDYHLIQINEKWKVARMKFNLKFMDGNADMGRMAQEETTI